MKLFKSESEKKTRYLQRVIEEGSLISPTAERSRIKNSSDHRRWLEEDPVYRQAYDNAMEEGEQRQIQAVFNLLCDGVREKQDKATERWILKNCGADALETIKQGGYPEWK